MATIVLGSQFGDEGIHSMVRVESFPIDHLSYCFVSFANIHSGKGKLVDILSSSSHICARAAGGNNAGHTIVTGGITVRLAQPIIFLFKSIGSQEKLFLDSRASLQCIVLTWRNTIV